MNTIRQYLEQATLRRSTGVYAMILLVALFALAACGSDDTAAAQSCIFQSDCGLGYACSQASDECLQVACDNCVNDPNLICLITPEHPEGTCSSPECTVNGQCDEAAGETCNAGVCGVGGGSTDTCSNDDECPDGQECNFADQCVPKETATEDCGGCATGETCNATSGQCEGGTEDCGGCQADQTCNATSGECEAGSTVDCGGCAANETCNTGTGQCEAGSTEDCGGCAGNETCNTTSGQCEAGTSTDACNGACTANQICDNGTCIENSCPPGSQTPETCAQDPVYNLFDSDGCYCSECLSDNDCTGGDTCTPNGECMSCAEECDPSLGGNACSQAGFFCISECCIECTGNSDCSVAGEVCVDGACAPPPNCTNDPDICRPGTTCQNGVCASDQAGPGGGLPGGLPDFGGAGVCDPVCPGGADACMLGMVCTCNSAGDCPTMNILGLPLPSPCLGGVCMSGIFGGL